VNRIDRSTMVFFDASCLIAATGRPEGGSGFVLSLCRRGLLRAAVSQPVLLEAETNVAANLAPKSLATYHRLLAETPMVVAPVPGAAELRAARAIVGEKDDHVLAAALGVEAPFLLTLDQRLAAAVNDARLSVRAFAPGASILGVLPAHQEFDALRP
jgi:predicted nucleic acid-binding protein